MNTKEYDIVIIGSGAAGLYSAYKISERKDFKGKILIITKSPFGESNSRYAQGGIAAVIKNSIRYFDMPIFRYFGINVIYSVQTHSRPFRTHINHVLKWRRCGRTRDGCKG